MYIKNELYRSDLEQTLDATVDVEALRKKTFLITGATGLIGSFLTDLLMYANETRGYDCTVYALGRDLSRLRERFASYKDSERLRFIVQDVCDEIQSEDTVDYVIHAAGNGYPAAFREDPVGTMRAALFGTERILQFAYREHVTKVLYISSGEIYGEHGRDAVTEKESGYVDCTSVRACYPSAKRAAETLVVSYIRQYGICASIIRPGHTYGPNTSDRDNRANAQFVRAAVRGEDIVLNSAGRQLRSYTYIADHASGLLTVLLAGASGEAYNIANRNSCATIADFAREAACCGGCECRFQEAQGTAKEELSPISGAVLDAGKLERLGWKGRYTIREGILHTYQIVKEQNGN